MRARDLRAALSDTGISLLETSQSASVCSPSWRSDPAVLKAVSTGTLDTRDCGGGASVYTPSSPVALMSSSGREHEGTKLREQSSGTHCFQPSPFPLQMQPRVG